MFKFAFLLLFLFQQSDEVSIVSDLKTGKQECVESPEQVCTWTGGVTVTYQDIVVKADTATYNHSKNTLSAESRVRFTRADERLDGDSLDLDLKAKAGTIVGVNGNLGPGYFFSAGKAQRFEDGHYELWDATVTTCGESKPDWTFHHNHVRIIPDHSVSSSGTIFRLEGVPLFYLPYFVVPTENRERSTGFLLPSTSTSTTKGRMLRESFYWAINRSADATFTAEYFSKRGMSGQANFRAVPNENSRIDVTGFFVRDRKGQGGESARIFTYSDLGDGYRGVVDMNLVSSFVFRNVFEEGFNTISSPIEHSLAFLTRNQPWYSYNFVYNRTGVFFSNLTNPVVTRKLPAFEAAMPEWKIPSLPAYFKLDTGIAGGSRRDPLVRTRRFVGRMDLQPVLEAPLINTPFLEWSHRLGVRETWYSSVKPEAGASGSLNRALVDYSTSLAGPELERDFGTWRHIVQPSVDYRRVRGGDRFRETIVVDDVDLLTDTNEVEYAVTNRIFTSREIFSWRIAQQYFFDPTFGGAARPGVRNQFAPLLSLTGFAYADGQRRFSPIVSNMRLSTTESSSTDLQIDYDSERHRFESAGISGGVNRGQGFANIAYFFRRNTSIQFPSNQFRGNFGYGNELKPGLSFALSTAYDVQRSLFQESVTQLRYNFDCYGLSLEFMQTNLAERKESRIRFAFSLKNIGTFGTIRRQDRIF